MSETQSVLLQAAGILSLAFAVFHLLFWRLFNWRSELSRLSPLNRAVVQVLNLSLTFVFVLFAYVLLFHRQEIVSTTLGRTLLAGMSGFWFLRMIEQGYFFGLKRRASLVFAAVFLLMSLLHAAVLLL